MSDHDSYSDCPSMYRDTTPAVGPLLQTLASPRKATPTLPSASSYLNGPAIASRPYPSDELNCLAPIN
jgi:hypothetical protein